MSARCMFLRAVPRPHNPPWRTPALARLVRVCDQYQLSAPLLSHVGALVLTMHQDQRWLHGQRDVLDDFIASGGTLVVQGQVAYPFVDGLSCFRPAKNLRVADYAIDLHQPHPIFAGIEPSSLNRRRGVVGFYAHGSNPPPPNATILSSMAGGTIPIDWELAIGKGRLLVHPGNDLWTTFATTADNHAFADRLVQWATTE